MSVRDAYLHRDGIPRYKVFHFSGEFRFKNHFHLSDVNYYNLTLLNRSFKSIGVIAEYTLYQSPGLYGHESGGGVQFNFPWFHLELKGFYRTRTVRVQEKVFHGYFWLEIPVMKWISLHAKGIGLPFVRVKDGLDWSELEVGGGVDFHPYKDGRVRFSGYRKSETGFSASLEYLHRFKYFEIIATGQVQPTQFQLGFSFPFKSSRTQYTGSYTPSLGFSHFTGLMLYWPYMDNGNANLDELGGKMNKEISDANL